MKKPKKHLKSLARLNAYLKKEGSRLEKLIARISDIEDSALIKGVVAHLSERREIALVDLGLVDAASEAMRKASKVSKAARAKKASAKKAPKVNKAVTKEPRKTTRKGAQKASAKAAPAKRPGRRKVKAVNPTNS